MSEPVSNNPGPLPSTKTVLTKDQTVEDAFASILINNFALMQAWVSVAVAGEDIEGVHEMRVALRRMRSALSIFRKAMPRSITDRWGEEMRWIANSLGPARDRDVFIAETLKPMTDKIHLPDGEKRMGELARQHRDEAYDHLREMLASERFQAFASGLPQWCAKRTWREEAWGEVSREGLQGPISKYAAKVMSKRMGQVLAGGARIAEMSDLELHMLRIECKKLRYATEFFFSLFDPQGMSRFTQALKEIQGILGILHDVSVLPTVLDQLLLLDETRPVSEYAGAMIGWRSREALDLRQQLTAKWAVFAMTPQPWLTPKAIQAMEEAMEETKEEARKETRKESRKDVLPEALAETLAETLATYRKINQKNKKITRKRK